MKQIFNKTLLAVSMAMVMTPVVYATNGLAPTGLGQLHKAMGGAAVGNPLNTTTMMTNPAAASFVEDGYDAALELFRPDRTIKSNIFPKEHKGNEDENFFVPEAAYKKDIGSFSIGISAYGNGGMNTSFKENDSPAFPSPGGAGAPPAGTPIPFNTNALGQPEGKTGINLEQLFIAPTISKKINNNHSVGLSINLVAQRFEAKGITALAPGSQSPGKFSDQGKSSATGIGATIGWMGKFSDKVTVGASYRLKTKMGKFDKYAGLFPDQGRMDVPAALTIGASLKVTPRTLVALDVQQIYYSNVNAVGNSSHARANNQKFGMDNGPGFGWEDQTVIKVGVKQQVNNKLALLAGYNHGDSPMGSDDTFFGALAPAVVEDHLSLGVEYKLGKGAIVGSYTHTFANEVKGDKNQDPNKFQPFDLEMEQNAIGIGYSRKF